MRFFLLENGCWKIFNEYAKEYILHQSSPMLFVVIIEQKIFYNQAVDITMVDLIGIEIGLIPNGVQNIVVIRPHKAYIPSGISLLLSFIIDALISSILLEVYVVKRHKKLPVPCFLPKECTCSVCIYL